MWFDGYECVLCSSDPLLMLLQIVLNARSIILKFIKLRYLKLGMTYYISHIYIYIYDVSDKAGCFKCTESVS